MLLNTFTEDPLVTNQVEISPYCLEHFDNGNLDFFVQEKIAPMAWSPVAGGKILNPYDEKGQGILRALQEVAVELGVAPVDKVIYAWLFRHPARIIPVVGSGRTDRIRFATEALNISMSLEQWYRIFIASRGKELP
jgi:predicted oxidoreductase